MEEGTSDDGRGNGGRGGVRNRMHGCDTDGERGNGDVVDGYGVAHDMDSHTGDSDDNDGEEDDGRRDGHDGGGSGDDGEGWGASCELMGARG